MIEMLIGAMVVSAMLCVVPAALVDVYATAKAAAAGQWDVVEHGRQRPGLVERVGRAWGQRRADRNRQAGGDGDWRPGAYAYANDVYHGWWEDRLDRRSKTRAARPEWEYDPDRPKWHERVDAAIAGKVAALRAGWNRAAGQRPAGDPQPAPQPAAPDPAELPPGTWTVSDAGEQVPLTPVAPEPDPDPAELAQNPQEDTMTAPTATTATDMNTNADARRHFVQMANAAAALSEAAALAEQARAKLAALAASGVDGLGAKAFDAGAQADAAQAADVVNLGTLADWSEAADNAAAAARQGLAHLDKYRDAEDMVAANQVDPTTLAATSS